MQLQGVDEPQRKFFWPAELLQHNEEESDDEEEDYADEDDADDLLSVSNAQCRWCKFICLKTKDQKLATNTPWK